MEALTESRLEKTGLSSVRVLARVVNRRSPTCRVIKLFVLISEGVDSEFRTSGEVIGVGIVAILVVDTA